VTPLADFFVLATAASTRQLKVLMETTCERARLEANVKPTHVEGAAESGWILVDFDDVVVHLFDLERRAYYALEALWSEAPLVARMP
jgi:ribosome-associated protein